MNFLITTLISFLVFAGLVALAGTFFDLTGWDLIVLGLSSLIGSAIFVFCIELQEFRRIADRHRRQGQFMLVKHVAAHTRAMREAAQVSERG